jgi:hypothetical protein
MNPLSNNLRVSFNEETSTLEIRHAEPSEFRWPLVEIRTETIADLSFDEAAKFIGERIMLLIPSYREVFKDYLWSDDGQTPPKKT